jgi:hypothetical protein
MEELFSSKSSSRERRNTTSNHSKTKGEKSLSRSLSPVTNRVLRQDDDYYQRFGDGIQ